ncbi:MAG: GspE/PulE family protein [Gammaproteobacteria bacterium]|nr:GspE/PulE family protein [Gammaproteobacteria bacterium]
MLEALYEKFDGREAALPGILGELFGYPAAGSRQILSLEVNVALLNLNQSRDRQCVIVGESTSPTVLFCNPFDQELRSWLESLVQADLHWILVSPGDLNAYISRREQGTKAMDSVVQASGGKIDAGQELDALSLASISQDSSPVVKLVHSTLYDALRAGASDIHIETGSAALEIRYRIDGVLMHVASVAGADIAEQVISRVKVMSELDIAERRIPQDGRFKSAYDGRPIDFRVSIMPSSFGEDAVLRVLDKQAVTTQMTELTLSSLGFADGMIGALRKLSDRPYGMLLVTGPTGSGKTTTLYAALSETNSGAGKVVTIEDPVEYELPGVLQIPVNEKKGLTFARGLRSILRHDPDKIMVGEIRDPETAQIAIQSALTGHLVFTTVHANNVFDVLSRFTHMGVDPYSFVSALNGILAQRLLRVVCSKCAEKIVPTTAMLEATGEPLEVASAFNWRVGRGCSDCRGTGYKGRKAVGELLVLSDELREAIVERVPVRRLKELARKEGLKSINSAAMDMVRDGLTTIEEVNRVTTMA